MSRRAIKAINWAALAEKIPETERNAFAAFKAKSDQYLRSMAQNPETPPKIDWAYYKKGVASPGLVEKFQKEYEALSIPYPADKYTDKIVAEEKILEAEMAEFLVKVNKSIEDCKENIERVRNLLPFSEMTMEDATEILPNDVPSMENPRVWPHADDYQPDYLRTLPKEEH